MAIETLAARAGATPLRIRRVRKITLMLLFIVGIVNSPDRSSLSVVGEVIHADLGLSATEFGVLPSAPSLFYGFAQLPSGILLDCIGPRIVLGAGLIFWSAMQALIGTVNSFPHFILLRIGLGIGEAPFMPAGVKSINDWYAQRERGTTAGIFNSSTVLGQAIAPPALVIMQLAWGWRTMFVVIGLTGILVDLRWYAGYRNCRHFTPQEEEQQYLASEEVARPVLKFSEWLALFKRRTTWGMILSSSGVDYTGWLYTAWLPGYLQVQQRLSLARTGWVAAIPFLAAAVGMWVNGLMVDVLARRGYDLVKIRKMAIVIDPVLSALDTPLVVQPSTPTQAVASISMALLCVHFAGTSAWEPVQVLVAECEVASAVATQDFGSFVSVSPAPTVTGWVVDTTHSFNLAPVIAAGVTFTGALYYLFTVKTRID